MRLFFKSAPCMGHVGAGQTGLALEGYLQQIIWVLLTRSNRRIFQAKPCVDWRSCIVHGGKSEVMGHDITMWHTCMRLVCIALFIQCWAKSWMRVDAGPGPGLSAPALPSPKCLWKHTQSQVNIFLCTNLSFSSSDLSLYKLVLYNHAFVAASVFVLPLHHGTQCCTSEM